MSRITVISVGDKNCPNFLAYSKRITLSLKVITLRPKDDMTKYIDFSTYVIVLDEKGVIMTSTAFAKKLSEGCPITFVVGGAYGVPDDIKKRANMLLAFGHMTWPHALARVMLIEQIYRAQQIMNNHPYHK